MVTFNALLKSDELEFVSKTVGGLTLKSSSGLERPKLQVWRWECQRNRFRKYAYDENGRK